MTATTYAWNSISSAQTDADSPIDTVLMEGIRQNLIHLREWVGDGFTPAKDHDHDGVNSKSVLLADAVVSVAKLRLSQGSFSANISGTFYFPVSRYSHVPSLSKSGSVYWVQLFMQTQQHASITGEAWEIMVQTQSGNEEPFTVYWDYHAN